MRKSLLILAAAVAPLTLAQTQTFTYTYSGLPLPIYPDDWNVVSIIRLFVPNSLAITKVTASVQVQYAGVGDLNVYLYSANGTRTKLLERNCGSLQNINATFDDSAPTRFSNSCPQPGSGGSFQGNEPLENSNGQNSYGYWRLAVENNGSGNTGLFTGFSVSITGTTLGPPFFTSDSVVSASSFNSGAIAPGDQLALPGANLGPTPGVRAGAGNLPTNLAGTTVTFDGVPAPLYFVSGGVVELQAPTTLTPGGSTSIKVTTSSGTSLAVPIPRGSGGEKQELKPLSRQTPGHASRWRHVSPVFVSALTATSRLFGPKIQTIVVTDFVSRMIRPILSFSAEGGFRSWVWRHNGCFALSLWQRA